MNYSTTIEYLYNRLPVFQNQGASALKNGLDGIIKLCNYLGNPQEKFKCIHVAGTNGKGSTSHMLASILQESGYKTGLYTSPHLLDFRERIRINGKVISKKAVLDFVAENKAFIEANSFSFFEVTVAIAFKYFADNQVDIAVIEVGLGGRLDSTNIINPILSIIINISDDHKQILGETLPEIASEKAGIIKKNVPVVVSTTQSEIDKIFKEKADSVGAKIYFADQNFKVTNTILGENYREIDIQNQEKVIKSYQLDLKGTYQQYNVLGVIQAVELLNSLSFKISENQLKNGLKKVVKNTGLLGRWQKIGENPTIYCDTGHNFAGITEVLKNIQLQKFDKLHIIIGFVKDKDIENILKLLPKIAHSTGSGQATYYFCNANIPRALPSTDLHALALKNGLIGKSYESVEMAFKSAKKVAQTDDFIFVGGSTFVVADFLTYLKNIKN
jgi:dihydrofolate synthase / folylpolyglutamate synthase